MAGADPLYLSLAEKRSVLLELARRAERVRGLMLHVLGSADDLTAAEGAQPADVGSGRSGRGGDAGRLGDHRHLTVEERVPGLGRHPVEVAVDLEADEAVQ